MKIAFFIAAALGGACCGAAGAAAADLAVIEAYGEPGFGPGDLLPAQTAFALRAGQSVTVITVMGRKIVIRGPFTGAVGDAAGKPREDSAAEENRDRLRQVAMLFDPATRSRAAGAPASRATEPWVVDPETPGIYCVPTTTPELWRAEPRGPRNLSVRQLPNGALATFLWPAREAKIGWPLDIPVYDGGRYEFEAADALDPVKVSIRLLPPDARDLLARAAWMSRNHCAHQARLLVATHRVDTFLEGLIRKGNF
jgi:hypothetical protein